MSFDRSNISGIVSSACWLGLILESLLGGGLADDLAVGGLDCVLPLFGGLGSLGGRGVLFLTGDGQ